MKKWQFITIVLVFLIAGLLNVYFTEQPQPLQRLVSHTSSFELGGVRYNFDICAYWDPPLDSTSLIIAPSNFEFSVSSVAHTRSSRNSTYAVIYVGAGEIRAKPDTLYFVQDGKIEIEKSYQELGIDASRLTGFMNGRNEIGDYLHYLQPILEQLIHEHVKSQDPEMEKTPERN